jgi:hypothetical protein
MNDTTVRGSILYECGICGAYHPWEWSRDCREDANRVLPDEYAEFMGVDEFDLEIRTMDERVEADLGVERL